MEVRVRKYNEADFCDVNNVLKEAFGISKKSNSLNNDHIELVACVDRKVVGYLLLTRVFDPVISNNYFLIDYVCVKEEFRNKKIGSLLVNEAIGIARDNGGSYIQLTSSRFREAAHKLYENCGFVVRDSDIFRKELL